MARSATTIALITVADKGIGYETARVLGAALVLLLGVVAALVTRMAGTTVLVAARPKPAAWPPNGGSGTAPPCVATGHDLVEVNPRRQQ